MPLCTRNINFNKINNLLKTCKSSQSNINILNNIKNIMIKIKNARKWHFSSDKKKLNYNDIKNLLPPPDSVNQLSNTVKKSIIIYLYRLFSCLLLNFNDIFINTSNNTSNNNPYNIFLLYCVSFKEIFDHFKLKQSRIFPHNYLNSLNISKNILCQSYNYPDRPQRIQDSLFFRYKYNRYNIIRIKQSKNFWNIIMKKYIDDKPDDIPFQHTCYTYTIQPPKYENMYNNNTLYQKMCESRNQYLYRYKIISPFIQRMQYDYPVVSKNDKSIYKFDKTVTNKTIIDITKITDTEGLYMNSHEYDLLTEEQQNIYSNTIRNFKIIQYNSSNNPIRVVTYNTKNPPPSNGICTYENAISQFYHHIIDDPLIFRDYNSYGFTGPLNITEKKGRYIEEYGFAILSPTDQSAYIQAVYQATQYT